jgi:hypothetical protein
VFLMFEAVVDACDVCTLVRWLYDAW